MRFFLPANTERSSSFDRLRMRKVVVGAKPTILVLSLSKGEDRAGPETLSQRERVASVGEPGEGTRSPRAAFAVVCPLTPNPSPQGRGALRRAEA
jgi:hypothetical protein